MLIYKGAEASIYKKSYLNFPAVEKKRKKKNYRIKEIDEKIRKHRTKQEASMMIKARKSVETPFIFKVDLKKNAILMEYINGTSLKKEFKKGKNLDLIKETAKGVSKLHESNIIHGDLTTSNLISKKGKIYFIDFGLSFNSNKIEDKAVDLLNFKKMLKATHFNYFDFLWQNFKKEYKDKRVIQKIREIEKRTRYS